MSESYMSRSLSEKFFFPDFMAHDIAPFITNALAESPTLLQKPLQKLLHPRILSNSSKSWFIIIIINPISVFLIS